MTHDYTRPVGQVTQLIGNLNAWKKAREEKQLPVAILKRAILYLEDYRLLCKCEREKKYDTKRDQ